MKGKQYEKHIEFFEKKFLSDQTEAQIRPTEENLNNSQNLFGSLVESMMTESNEKKPRESYQQGQRNLTFLSEIKEETDKKHKNKRKYKFSVKYYSLEVFIGYCLTIGFMYLTRVANFPFFELIAIIVVSLSIKPVKVSNLFSLLSVPMAIANYNLGVWILTYPEIIICYFSTYIFTKTTWRSLLWIISTVIYAIFGYVILRLIGGNFEKDSHFNVVIYYVYPFLLVIIKVSSGLLNHINPYCSLFLLQISFFLVGISYGLILTLESNTIEFWYLLVMLTLDIVNTRYQFCIRFIESFIWPEIRNGEFVEAKCSGYASMHSFHLVFFAYMVIRLQLNSSRFNYHLEEEYLKEWFGPLVIWIFFSIYELISILKLRKRNNLMIIGERDNSFQNSCFRGLALSCGLWFFYLGFCIPAEILIEN